MTDSKKLLEDIRKEYQAKTVYVNAAGKTFTSMLEAAHSDARQICYNLISSAVEAGRANESTYDTLQAILDVMIVDTHNLESFSRFLQTATLPPEPKFDLVASDARKVRTAAHDDQ